MKKNRFKVLLLVITLLITTNTSYSSSRFNMTYLHYGSSKSYIKFINNTRNSLDSVSPNYLNINSDGNLETNNIDKDFISKVHASGIKVMPFLSNHWNREAGELALTKKEELVKQIVTLVEDNNFDGINIDIENLNGESKEAFTNFIELLRKNLNSNKQISVAVAANPYGTDKGWQGMYDYKALANYCDYLMIMTYDESYSGSDPGPVASIPFVEKSIKFALNTGVPSNKIVLGIPFYGRIWNTNDLENTEKENRIVGKGISSNNINSLLSFYNATTTYDSVSKTMKATFVVDIDDEKKNLYSWGVPVTEGNYEIWFDNDYTIKEKLKLVEKYNLKGTGSWSLGQENKDIWKCYKSWLNGNYFNDIDNHWAKNDILSVYQKDWMRGISSTEFGPYDKLTRAQAAVTIVRALDLDLIDTKSHFTDVKDTYWANKEIETAYYYNIIKGKGNDIFDPDNIITRQEMAQIFYNIIGTELSKTEEKKSFIDINENDWAYKAIIKTTNYGIFKGFDNNTFRPTEKVTRAQMASILNRSSAYMKLD